MHSTSASVWRFSYSTVDYVHSNWITLYRWGGHIYKETHLEIFTFDVLCANDETTGPTTAYHIAYGARDIPSLVPRLTWVKPGNKATTELVFGCVFGEHYQVVMPLTS